MFRTLLVVSLVCVATTANAQLFGRRGGCSSGSCNSQYNAATATSQVPLQSLLPLLVPPQATAKAEVTAPAPIVAVPQTVTVPLTFLAPVTPTVKVEALQAPVIAPSASAVALGVPTVLTVPVAVEQPRRLFRRATKQVTTATAKVETRTVPVGGLRSW